MSFSRNNSNEMNSKHGMSTEKASRVKSRGMRKEENFKGLLKDAEVIQGNKNKKDVQTKSGVTFSLKGGEEKGGGKRDARWQWFLLRDKNHIMKLSPAPLLLQIIEAFPKTREEFNEQREKVILRLGKALDDFVGYMALEENRRLFLFTSIFEAGNVECLGIHKDDQWHIFSRADILRLFAGNFVVRRNQNRQRTGAGEKVIFVFNNRVYGELEVRRDSRKYPSLLFTSTKNNWLTSLQLTYQKKEKVGRTVILYGESTRFREEFR